jgi:subtilase family serine protease
MNSTTNDNQTLKALFGAICLGLVFGGMAPANAAGRQVLSGHVPREVKELNLQPIGRLAATQHLGLGLALSMRNRAELDQLVNDIYDPANPRFHKYQSVQDNAERFGATPTDFQAVVDYLKAQGLTVTATYSNRLYVSLDGTVENVEKAFHVTMRVYQHPTEARTFYAPDVEPSLELDVPVEGINGLSNYHLPRNGQTGSGSGPGSTFRGSDFRHAYAPNVTLTGTGQTIGLFCGSTPFSPKSIYVYETNCGLSTNISVKAISVGGFNTNYAGGNDGEQCLDIEMSISMAPGASVREYETGDFGAALSQMQSENLCKQMSTSIAVLPPPSGGEATLELMAAQGQTFFCASGDNAAQTASSTIFWPSYSTNVTVVGGTELTTASPGGPWQSEMAWYGSAGGICDNSTLAEPIPIWQTVINMSLNQGSTSYRNIPDVSMCAASFWLVFSNAQNIGPIDGTSGASPLWAGFTALINEQAANDGLPTIGFLNPPIYSIGQSAAYTSCLHDITTGNNTWSDSPNAYYATNGYDLVTGWGSPNGQATINALLGYVGQIWVNFSDACPGNGSFTNAFCTLALGTNAVANGGTICLVGPHSTTATATIHKPMTLRAFYGSVTIGQ